MTKTYPIPTSWQNKAKITQDKYQELYQKSIENPEQFWRDQANIIDWISPPQNIKNTKWSKQDVSIKWYEGGKLNASANCIDRHLPHHKDKTAFIWEGDEPNNSKTITYQTLYEKVCRFANLLKAYNVKKGDRVTIYMPMVLEAVYAMLACARIGAIHNVVFGGFSPTALAGRIKDCQSDVLITANEGRRGGKTIPLKQNADEALATCPPMKAVFVVKINDNDCAMTKDQDIDYHQEIKQQEATCPPEPMDAQDPLFILYTSGSTGKPKGVLHATGGYLVYTALTFSYIFDYQPEDVYWCGADIGWVTGHSYMVYGPLLNGATNILFEGVPTYPTPARPWQICDQHKVSIFYTAPTALRALMGEGDSYVKQTSRKSLRLLGSVGEPINPAAWEWVYHVVGEGRCPIVDTWWQTETGGILITPLPGAHALKAGSATKPFFGIKPVLLNEKGDELSGKAQGALAMKTSWPSQMQTVWGNHQRFIDTYFSQYDGYYLTGDGARRDEDGYYWITGRLDDVLNVAGHRIGTAEIESSLVAHQNVAEAGIIGVPDELKGEAIYCFVVLNEGVLANDTLKNELIGKIRKDIGPIATPKTIQFAKGLPKTRSGKIMRRLLKKIAQMNLTGEKLDLGDVSTLADDKVVQDLLL